MKRYFNSLFLALLSFCIMSFPGVVKAKAQTAPAAAEAEPEYTEEEYDAYEKATQEADLDKRVTMLTAFVEKYPKSKLMSYIDSAYQTLMYDYMKTGKFDKLEAVAEQWYKTHPQDLQALGYIFTAAQKLGHDQKYVDAAEKIYAQKPSSDLAYSMMQTYKKLKNDAKFQQWSDKILADPKFAGDFGLRFEFVQKHADSKDSAKAAEYAQQTLKALDAATKPDSAPEAEWKKQTNTVRRVCHLTIGLNDYDKERYAEAMRSFQASNKVEKSGEAYYYIGMSQWKLKDPEEAMLSFARAEKIGGSTAAQSKEHVEEIYKQLHNNMTTGIEKVYKRAAEENEK